MLPRTPNLTPHRAQAGRSFPADSWTPDLIRQAELAADAGQLRWAAELCDALLGDDRVQGAREKLCALFGMPLVFEDSFGRARRKARRALEAEEDWWAAFSDESLAELLFWGVLLGVALAEVVWFERRGRLVPKLKVWHPRALSYDANACQWRVRTASGADVPVVVGDGQWVVFTPFSECSPWQHGAWRAVSRWWRLKRYAMFDWGRACEQAAGLRVASSEGGTEEDRQKLVEDLSNSGGDAVVALPPGWEMDQLAVPASTKELFDGIIHAADTATAITFLGQNLTTAVEGGSFAATAVHQTVSQGIIRARASSLSGCLRTQVLVPWAAFNFDSQESAPWPVWQVDPPDDATAAANNGEARSRTALTMSQNGAPIDWSALAREQGFTLTPAGAPPATATLDAATRDGIELVDAITARLRATLIEGSQPRVDATLAALDGAQSQEEVRERIIAVLREEPDPALVDEIAEAAVLARLTGRLSAQRP